MAVHVDQFERTAAEIADNAVGPMQAGNDAERGKLRLALAGEHIRSCLRQMRSAGRRDLPVLGVAAGGGGITKGR